MHQNINASMTGNINYVTTKHDMSEGWIEQ